MREVKIFHNPDARPQEWRVEDIDSDGDGGCDVVIFTGPHAAQRATRFADWLQTHTASRPTIEMARAFGW